MSSQTGMAAVGRSWRFSWRQLKRDWRSGDVLVLLIAVAIAVGATGSVSMLTDRVRQAMLRQGGDSIGGDLVLRLRAPLDQRRASLIDDAGLAVAHTAEFASVALNGDARSLVSVKAVDAAYPLRGSLKLAGQDPSAQQSVSHGPESGKAWLDRRAMIDLNVAVGDDIELGASRFTVAALLLLEPDRSTGFLGLAPRVMINRQDLAATGLIGPGSRVTHRSLLAGESDAVAAFRESFAAELQIGENLNTPSEAQPALRAALDRAEIFLNLAAMVSVILAGVAVAFAAWQQARSRMDEIALLKSLGAKKGFLRSALVAQLLLIAGGGIILGLLFAVFSQALLAIFLEQAFDFILPSANLMSLGPSVLIGAVISIGFGWPALASSLQTPPARVFQRALAQPSWPQRLVPIVAVLAVSGLLYWMAGNWTLALAMLLGLFVAALSYYAGAALVIRILWRVNPNKIGLRLGARAVTHRPQQSQFLAMVFGIGLTVLFILALVRNDVVQGWQADLSSSAPNRFILNVRKDQLETVTQGLQSAGVAEPKLFPMVRARLVGINGQAVSVGDFPNAEAGNLLRRELNLSWDSKFKDDNTLIKGNWWTAEDHGEPLVSIEETIGTRLGVGIGDQLRFDLAGEEFDLTIHSVRRVRWDSMEPNFYLVAAPGALDDYPATWISSFHLERSAEHELTELIRENSNIGLLDLQAILTQLQSIADRAILAVELVFGFALLAGIVVLYAAVRGSHAERMRDAQVMRSYGASRRTLLIAATTEFTILGSIAALLAVLIAQVVAAVIAQKMLDQPYRVDPASWLFAVTAGIALIAASGVLSLRPIFKKPA